MLAGSRVFLNDNAHLKTELNNRNLPLRISERSGSIGGVFGLDGGCPLRETSCYCGSHVPEL